jgi:NAD(P)-dependent dehydrogenase (short-subunit alcohol dehydrogenase family)
MTQFPESAVTTGALEVDLRGAFAVVIGATGGIGQAIAAGFARAGALVIATSRSSERLAETVALADGAKGTIEAASCDITDPASVAELAAMATAAHGPPRILVNSAGVMVPKPALELSVEEWDLVLDTQLRGAFLASQAFARPMRDAGYGKIINLSSTWAVTVAQGRSAYSAAKAGLGHLTSALALEWAPLGIRVNAIAPTATLTPAAEKRIRAEPEREAYLVERIPLGRLALPADVVGAALFLASNASDFITGETIMVDGGWRTAK